MIPNKIKMEKMIPIKKKGDPKQNKNGKNDSNK